MFGKPGWRRRGKGNRNRNRKIRNVRKRRNRNSIRKSGRNTSSSCQPDFHVPSPQIGCRYGACLAPC